MQWKNPKGTWKTKTLFIDMLGVEGIKRFKPPYTLQEFDVEKNGVKYKSLYKLYMQSTDEFEFVNTWLGGLTHWDSLQKSTWFSEGYRAHRGVEAWREDMRARDESLAKKALILAVNEGDISAAKKLFDISKRPSETKRGTFKKEEVRKEAAKVVEDKEFLDVAALRLGNVINLRD